MIRSTRSWRLAAAAAATGLVLAACGTTDDDGDNNESEGSGDCSLTLAFIGPKTGDYANLGLNIVRGAQLAVSQYSEGDNDCDVTLEEFDSQGDPAKATPIASDVVKDETVVGVIGPAFSGETDATGQTFADAGLPAVSASATNPDLSKNGWATFHRILPNDAVQSAAIQRFFENVVGAKKVFVVDDSSDYGAGIGGLVKEVVGDAVVDSAQIQQKQTDFSGVVTKIKASGADAVFFGGYYTEAGLLAKALRNADYKGAYASGDGSLDQGFIDAAGAAAAEGAILTCPCKLGDESFNADFEELTGEKPGTYSTEGFDAANIFLEGISEGNTTREDLLEFVNAYDGEGVSKAIKFTEEGEIEVQNVYSYLIKDGAIQPGEAIE